MPGSYTYRKHIVGGEFLRTAAVWLQSVHAVVTSPRTGSRSVWGARLAKASKWRCCAFWRISRCLSKSVYLYRFSYIYICLSCLGWLWFPKHVKDQCHSSIDQLSWCCFLGATVTSSVHISNCGIPFRSKGSGNWGSYSPPFELIILDAGNWIEPWDEQKSGDHSSNGFRPLPARGLAIPLPRDKVEAWEDRFKKACCIPWPHEV